MSEILALRKQIFDLYRDAGIAEDSPELQNLKRLATDMPPTAAAGESSTSYQSAPARGCRKRKAKTGIEIADFPPVDNEIWCALYIHEKSFGNRLSIDRMILGTIASVLAYSCYQHSATAVELGLHVGVRCLQCVDLAKCMSGDCVAYG